MQSLFSAPIWLWSLLFASAVTLPLLIHLINFLRYRRVKWAAMEFLMKSHRKKQKRILLTQLLLILSRICLLFAAIFLFGQIGCRTDSTSQFQDGLTHVVILDDSYSMGELQVTNQSQLASNSAAISGQTSQKVGKATCFQNAQQCVLDLADKLTRYPNQRLQLIRTSQSLGFNRKLNWDCDSNLIPELKKHFAAHGVSDDSNGMLKLSSSGFKELVEENSPVYLLSDFRDKDLQSDRAESWIGELSAVSGRLKIVDCSHQQTDQGNLFISRLEPEHDFVVAGIPFYLTLEVFNRSKRPRRNIEIKVRTASHNQSSPAELKVEDEPSAFVPELGPDEKQVLQIPIVVPTSGPILFEAELPADSLFVDNIFQRVVDVQPIHRLLLISDRQNQPTQYLRWVYEPKLAGSTVRSGIQVEQISSADFNQASAPSLDGIKVVFLLSDDLSSIKMIQQLEAFVDAGGLLFICPGRYAKATSLNQALYRDGTGLLPFPLDSVIELPRRPPNVDADIEILNESLRKYFQGESRKLLSLVRFDKKFIPPRNWSPQTESEVLVNIRGRATTPLITQSRFGKGTVLTILSSFDDQWNNWPKNPTFLVMMYRLIYQYLPFDAKQDLKVGQSLSGPGAQAASDLSTSARSWFQRTSRGLAFSHQRTVDENGRWTPRKKGIYIQEGAGEPILATHLDLAESDLAGSDRDSILEKLRLPAVDYTPWNQFSISELESSSSMTGWFLLVLAVLFTVEQWLALRSGFHNRRDVQPHPRIPGGRRV